jgi:DNA primase
LGRIPEATINEIRARVDVVDFVGRYVQLKKAGRNHKGLCPFHDEKTPSFNVSSDKQIFHCFGCQAGGDVVGFLMKHENLTFPEAVRTIARECGVEVPEERGNPADRGISERIYEANEVAQRAYVDALATADGQIARDYLAKRLISDEDIVELGIGYAPDRWDTVERALKAKKIDGKLGSTAGLLADRKGGDGHYDRLRGRVTFPIYDVRRRIVGFGGRVLSPDQEPKYLNTPETPVFRKRESFYGFPWALEAIRRSDRAIICEGYFDRIALHRAGIGEGLATCGTSLTREHARNLHRRTKTVVLLFDGDSAGEKAIEKALEVLLPEGLRVRAALLPNKQDPDDYLNEYGADALNAFVDKAPDALELLIRRATERGVASPAAKADAVGHVAPIIALVANPVEREAYVRRLALSTDSSESAVTTLVRAAVRGQNSQPEVDLAVAKPRRTGPEDRHLSLLCHVLLRYPTLATAEMRDRVEAALPDDEWRRVALALLDASEDGWVDADGAIDHHRVIEGLGVDARSLLQATAAGDDPLDADARPESVVADVLAWFENRANKHKNKLVTQQLRDSAGSDDAEALLVEKQRQLDEKRARLRAQDAAPAAAQGVVR